MSALLLIDVQQAFGGTTWGARNNPDAERNIASLLAAWRERGLPIIHVRHDSVEPQSPLRPGLPGNQFTPEAMPQAGEPVFGKHVNSAFIGTELEKYLRQHGIQNLVMAGMTTDHCVSTSARMAANLGFNVVVVDDACCTFDRRDQDGDHYSAELMHRTALASLHKEFARVVRTNDVLNARAQSSTS